jgi:predicted deacylase
MKPSTLSSILIIIICIISLMYIYQSPKIVVITSRPDLEIEKPIMLVVGGTHGNEPAGAEAAYQFIDNVKSTGLKKGTLIVIPNANKWGLKFNLRYLPAELMSFSILGKSDLNRSYSYNGEESRTRISKKIQELVLLSDWVIDLHEGYDFHQINNNSMGSGIYPGNTSESHAIVPSLLESVNEIIPVKEHKFVSREWSDENGTLRMYCNNNNKNYILVETTGQNDIQPLNIRVDQHLRILYEMLFQLKFL